MKDIDDLKKREDLAIEEIKEFAKKAKKLIEEITVDTLLDGGLNPYMTAALGLDIEESVEVFIHKRVERSLGTSFGTVIEKFLATLLGGKRGKDLKECKGKKEKPWYCWWDIIIEKPFEEKNKKWKGVVLAVKSASTNINKDIAEEFVKHAKEAEKNGYRPFLVFTYGKKVWSAVAPTIKKHNMKPKDYVLVGRDLYKKFLGVKQDYYDRIIERIVEEVQAEDLEFAKVVERKKQALLKELKHKYGDDIMKLLKDLT